MKLAQVVDKPFPLANTYAMQIADLISTTEAIELLGVDRSTLSRYVKFGDIAPAKRFGTGPKSPMVFWRSDIEALRATKVAAGVIPA